MPPDRGPAAYHTTDSAPAGRCRPIVGLRRIIRQIPRRRGAVGRVTRKAPRLHILVNHQGSYLGLGSRQARRARRVAAARRMATARGGDHAALPAGRGCGLRAAGAAPPSCLGAPTPRTMSRRHPFSGSVSWRGIAPRSRRGRFPALSLPRRPSPGGPPMRHPRKSLRSLRMERGSKYSSPVILDTFSNSTGWALAGKLHHAAARPSPSSSPPTAAAW